jgi:diguanylate cyclase (GGDEF)-like protein/PAS domain S-box-containing protein
LWADLSAYCEISHVTAENLSSFSGIQITVAELNALRIAPDPMTDPRNRSRRRDDRSATPTGNAPGPGTERANVLLVDDDPERLVALEHAVGPLEQNVVTARTREEALARVAEREYAVVVLDLDTFGTGGYDTAAALRRHRGSRHTPIILLMNEAEAMQTTRGYELGAVDCLVRPVIPEVVRTKVGLFVQLYLTAREAKRLESQRTTQEMIEALPNPIYFTGTDGRYRGVNKAWEQFFGISRGDVIGKSPRELFAADRAAAQQVETINRALLRKPGTKTYEAAIATPDGALHDVVYYTATYGGAEGPASGVIGTIVDITERKQAEKRQAMEHAVTRALAEATSLEQAITKVIETICLSLGWQHGAYWHWDPKAHVLRYGESWSVDVPAIREYDALIGKRAAVAGPADEGLMRRAFASRKPVWVADISKDRTFRRRAYAIKAGLRAAFAFPLLRGTEVLGVMEFLQRDAREPDTVLVRIAESIGSEIGQYIVRTQAEEAVKFVALHDALTGLPNRITFNERLTRAIAQARRHGRTLAVLFIDLDRFKLINDTLGHESGDQVLRDAAERLVTNLRAGDTVARLGGDEFVVLLEEVAERYYVGSICRKLIAALGAPFTINGREYHVTASIGVSVYPDDGEDAATLLKNADIAMYRAKEQGRNVHEFYSHAIGAGRAERLNLQAGLRRALDRDELILHYQPQIEACTGRIVGMEALVRWQHPELGLLEPERFIRVAEESGLIVPLGEWVTHTACMAHRRWQAMHIAPARIAVNLSPRQFLHAGLLKDMMRVLKHTRCKGQFLELEITESMVMQDPAGAVKLIEQIKELGVRISIDDFGTGYSSIAYLKRFPIDSLKIDGSFIVDVPHDPSNVAITQAVIAMARTLQLTVIAEGVETREQFAFLRGRGCDEVQGYYFSAPLPIDQATTLLEQATETASITDNHPATASVR